MKKKKLAGLISSLACISLIGVGFASWVITGDDSKTSENGTITAEAITDGSVTIGTMTWGQGKNDGNIKFDANGAAVTQPWLTSDTKGEDLTAVLTVPVENFDNLEGGTITAELKVNDSNGVDNGVYKKAQDAKLIGANPTPKITNNGNGNFEVSLTFTWGEHFGGLNPYEFYNAKGPTVALAGSTYKADALKNMPLIQKLNGVTFTLVIKATAKTTTA